MKIVLERLNHKIFMNQLKIRTIIGPLCCFDALIFLNSDNND